MNKYLKPTVTIGIPAYNEAASLAELIPKLLSQRRASFMIKEIIVVSDGSTDVTSKIIQNFSNSAIRLIENASRRGKSDCINTILKESKSDILVLLDADLSIKSETIIESLVSPIIQNPAIQLTSGFVKWNTPRNIAEHLSDRSYEIWRKTYSYPTENALYHCTGSLRAFGKKLYKKITFVDKSADDAYSFLECRRLGFEFASAGDLDIYEMLPSTIKDVLSRTIRFLQSKDVQLDSFPRDLVEKYYTVKPIHKSKALLWSFVQQPHWTTLYIVFRLYAGLSLRFFPPSKTSLWEIAMSTKKYD
jgi:glycosyltransferase involved in cell wall biosynthesis